MRILYGVVGEGMGHAIRSTAVLDDLIGGDPPHDVRIVASGRARDYLAQRFSDVHPIWGLTLAYKGNEVRNWQTLAQNLQGGLRGLPSNVRDLVRHAEDFAPDVVISDFETFSYVFGKVHRVPVISVDNIQMIARCRHDPDVTAGAEKDFRVARQIVRSKLPAAYHYVITTFFEPPLAAPRTTLVPSLLRREVLEAEPRTGDHLLVYQTAEGSTALPEALRAAGRPVRVYGYRRDLTEPVRDGDLTYMPFDDTRFVDDMAGAAGVIAGGGYTSISEAVYLKKPVLSIPLGGQFEQLMNARYIGKLGFGTMADRPTPEVVARFSAGLDRYAERLAGHDQDGNVVAMRTIRELMASAVAGRRPA